MWKLTLESTPVCADAFINEPRAGTGMRSEALASGTKFKGAPKNSRVKMAIIGMP